MSNHSKQVILVRRDLRLKRAAMAALVARASAEFLLDNDESERGDTMTIKLTPPEASWMASGRQVIVLGVSSESMLQSYLFKAEMAGIQCYPVSTGDGAGGYSVVAAALGPDDVDKVDEVTGRLKLI